MVLIKDGLSSATAGVTSDNRLRTSAATTSIEHVVNHHNGDAYSVIFEMSASAADDCVFFMKNENTNGKDLVVEGIRFCVDSACIVSVKIGDTGTPASPSSLTPVNLSAESGKSADGTFNQGPSLDNGSALTGGNTIYTYRYTAATSEYVNFEQDVILGRNNALTIYMNNATTTVTGTFDINYHSHC